MAEKMVLREIKATALSAVGIRCSAILDQRVAADRAQTAGVDVEVWEKFL